MITCYYDETTTTMTTRRHIKVVLNYFQAEKIIISVAADTYYTPVLIKKNNIKNQSKSTNTSTHVLLT